MCDENDVLVASATQFQLSRLQNKRQFLEMRRGVYFYPCIHVTFGSIELAALRTYLSVLVQKKPIILNAIYPRLRLRNKEN
ncbi:hypothetical protein PGB90_002354 [Kerria lacca]